MSAEEYKSCHSMVQIVGAPYARANKMECSSAINLWSFIFVVVALELTFVFVKTSNGIHRIAEHLETLNRHFVKNDEIFDQTIIIKT